MKLSANMMLNEKLDYIAQGATVDEQVERARNVASIDGTFGPLMRMATIKEEKISGLPVGMPETYKVDSAMPDGIANTTTRQEFRRIKNFGPNGPMQNVPTYKREINWIQIMEGLHWKEANVLIHIKDQTLFLIYPNMFEVLTKLGTQINIENVPEKKTKKNKK
jgi:hypothetical protein